MRLACCNPAPQSVLRLPSFLASAGNPCCPAWVSVPPTPLCLRTCPGDVSHCILLPAELLLECLHTQRTLLPGFHRPVLRDLQITVLCCRSHLGWSQGGLQGSQKVPKKGLFSQAFGIQQPASSACLSPALWLCNVPPLWVAQKKSSRVLHLV